MKQEVGNLSNQSSMKLDGVVNHFIEVARNRLLLILSLIHI